MSVMSFYNIAVLAFVCLTGFALVQPSHAQNNIQDYLDAHNSARAQVGVANIEWDIKLQDFANNYVRSKLGNCDLVHSGGPYGENLAKGSGEFTGAAAVNLWVAEKLNYDYPSNTCAAGKVCGHYTQVVWRNSLRVGCARLQCNNGWWYISCNYDPPGNFVGQRPY